VVRISLHYPIAIPTQCTHLIFVTMNHPEVLPLMVVEEHQ